MKTSEDKILELESRIRALEEKMSKIKYSSFIHILNNGSYKPIGFRKLKQQRDGKRNI